MRTELKRRELGELIGAAFELGCDHFGVLYLILLTCSIPVVVLQATMLGDFGQNTNPFAAVDQLNSFIVLVGGTQLIVRPFSEGLCLVLATRYFMGERDPFKASLGVVFRRYFALLILLFSVDMLTALGCCALIVPGVIAATFFHVAAVVLIVEERPWTQAMERSAQLVKGYFWEVFAFWMVIKFLIPMIMGPVSMLVELALAEHVVAKVVLQDMIQMAFMIIPTVGPVVMYYHLRVVKEAYDVQVLAQLVDEIGEAHADGAAAPQL